MYAAADARDSLSESQGLASTKEITSISAELRADRHIARPYVVKTDGFTSGQSNCSAGASWSGHGKGFGIDRQPHLPQLSSKRLVPSGSRGRAELRGHMARVKRDPLEAAATVALAQDTKNRPPTLEPSRKIRKRQLLLQPEARPSNAKALHVGINHGVLRNAQLALNNGCFWLLRRLYDLSPIAGPKRYRRKRCELPLAGLYCLSRGLATVPPIQPAFTGWGHLL